MKKLEDSIPDISMFNAWKGQRIEHRVYDELTLWIFSPDGELISETRYNNH